MSMRENTSRWAVISLILFIMCGGAFAGKTIYVDDDAAGVNDGSSWADAYKFLQDALADADSADKPVEIRVAQGIYWPDENVSEPNGTGDRTATFQLISGVTLKGGYAGLGQADPDARDIKAYETILSGDLGNFVYPDVPAQFNDGGPDEDVNDPRDMWLTRSRIDNSYHVVTGSGTDSTAVLDGFTITAGHAFEFGKYPPVLPPIDDPKNRGGGMYNYEGSPTVSNCKFSVNSARCGAGMCNWFSDPNVVDCTFTLNASGFRIGGGGMYNFNSSPTLVDCTLSRNWAEESGGGMCICEGGNPVLIDCTFIDNTAGEGGGVFVYRSDPKLVGCTFIGNSAITGLIHVSPGDGGGGYVWQGNPELVGCTFIANSAGEGGGLGFRESRPTVKSCTFIDNSASSGGGIALDFDNGLMMSDCVIRANRAVRHGGGFYLQTALCGGTPIVTSITRCLISGNKAGDSGGGIHYGYAPLDLTNCTIVGNFANVCGGVWYRFYGTGMVSNCILWDNRDNGGDVESAQIRAGFYVEQGQYPVNYCCVQGLTGDFGGYGNIAADPCFAEIGYYDLNETPENVDDDFWVDGDYHLKSQTGRWDENNGRWTKDDVTSPCIDVGDPACPIGPEPFPNGGIVNMGTYGGSVEASKSYFGQPPCDTIVAGDINGDCRVDFLDLEFLTQHWLEHEIGRASNPSPSDGATDVRSEYPGRSPGALGWTAGVNAVSHDVYLGTDRMSVADAHRGSPEYIGNRFENSYSAWGLFQSRTTRYWRVDEIGYLGKATGTVWSFTPGGD